jgi:hypothetical protein
MRRDYKYLYRPPAAPFVGTARGYTDPVQTDGERRALTSLLAKRRAKLRRAKAAERWIVFTVTLLLAIAMWPVLLPVGVVLLAKAFWRRYAPATEGRRTAPAIHRAGTPASSSRRKESAESRGGDIFRNLSTGRACGV